MGETPYKSDEQQRDRELRARRAEVLSALIREFSPPIVTLQETNAEVLSLVALEGFEVLLGPAGLATLVRKSEYLVIGKGDSGGRVHLVLLDRVDGRPAGLALANFHLPVLYKSEDDRRDTAHALLRGMEKWRESAHPRFEVFSGDLNLPPYDPFVVGKSGLHANRDLAFVMPRGSVGRGLYNPTWFAYGGGCGALGTYYLDSVPHGPWQLPDQVLLDPRLASDVVVSVRVLTHAGGVQLTTESGRPSKNRGSDHLPLLVQLTAGTP